MTEQVLEVPSEVLAPASPNAATIPVATYCLHCDFVGGAMRIPDETCRDKCACHHAPEDMTLEKAISILKTVLDHPDPMFHSSVILGAAQDHIVDMLNTVFYLVFGGGPDTGKGTANAAAMALCRNGTVLGGSSGPYLRDTLGNDRAVAISEFETLLKENPQLLAVVRNGNRRVTAKIGIKVPAGKGWTNADVDTFGYKTMDFHDRLDSHVLGRALQFEMVRSRNLDVAMDAEYLRERLEPVRAWLAYRARLARSIGWTSDRVRATWDSSAFRDRVKAFRNAWGRHGIIAAYLLLIDDIFEFGLEAKIRVLMDAREPELSPLAQEVQEAIDALAGDKPTADMQLLVQYEILRHVNEGRASLKLRPLSSITGALRELGFSPKSGDWIPAKKNRSGANRGKAVVLPYQLVQAWRGADGAKGANGATPPDPLHMEGEAKSGTLGIPGTSPLERAAPSSSLNEKDLEGAKSHVRSLLKEDRGRDDESLVAGLVFAFRIEEAEAQAIVQSLRGESVDPKSTAEKVVTGG